MENNKYSKLLWSGADSNVYLENGIVRKYYMSSSAIANDLQWNLKWYTNIKKSKLTKEILEIYHNIHHELSKFDFIIDVDGSDDLDLVQKINVKIIDLWNIKIKKSYMINDKSPVLITEPIFVQENIYWWIDDIHKVFSNYYMEKYFTNIWLECLSNIHPMNYKITWFKNWTLEITITDLWSAIYQLIFYDWKYIYNRISHNKWKSPDQYEKPPKTPEEIKSEKEIIKTVFE